MMCRIMHLTDRRPTGYNVSEINPPGIIPINQMNGGL